MTDKRGKLYQPFQQFIPLMTVNKIKKDFVVVAVRPVEMLKKHSSFFIEIK